MNNREVIDQVERGYRMAQPSNISYPETKTMPKEVGIAQANVYKVSLFCQFGLKGGLHKQLNGANLCCLTDVI
jgi:hypothetical protein